LQLIQLLVKPVGSLTRSLLGQLLQPLLPLAGLVDSCPAASDASSTEQGLQSIHHSRAIFDQAPITAGQFLQGPQALATLIDRRQLAVAQPLGQLAGIHLVGLVSRRPQLVLAGITHHHLFNVRTQHIVQPSGKRTLFQRYVQHTPQSADEIHDGAGFGLNDRLHHTFPSFIEDRDDDRCLMHIHANILDTHRMPPFLSQRFARAAVVLLVGCPTLPPETKGGVLS
jgi:hypothetical protein